MKSFLFAFALVTSFVAPITPRAHGADPAASASVGAAMTEAAQKYLAALNADKLAIAKMAFDDPRRLDWHNIPKPERKGLQLHDMTAEQQELCHTILRAALSDSGYARLQNILALENNLREGEKDLVGGHLRDPLRYFLTIFGEPAATGAWGWSFEGHHCSLNFVVRDGAVTCDTPSFWGCCPATVKTFVEGGPAIGTRTLAQEEQLGFDLLAAFDEAQLARVVVAEKAPDDYRNAGLPEPPHEGPAGLPASHMTPPQQEILHRLLETYCGHLAADLAAARMKEIEAANFGAVHFAWLGARQPGIGHAYRIQGPTFLLELVNIQSDPAGNPANHIHSVWRTLPQDFALTEK